MAQPLADLLDRHLVILQQAAAAGAPEIVPADVGHGRECGGLNRALAAGEALGPELARRSAQLLQRVVQVGDQGCAEMAEFGRVKLKLFKRFLKLGQMR